MADEFSIKLDLSEVIAAHKDLTEQINRKLQAAARNLAMQTHAHVKEQAAAKLRTRRDIYNENLDFEQLDTNTWAVVVREKARWIEDGQEPHSMLDDLLASPKAKRAKDGSKYITIPFKHSGKAPTKQTHTERELLGALKTEMKKMKISYGKVERNPDGSPKTGLLHSFDLNKPTQNRPAHGSEGPAGRAFSAHSPDSAEGPAGRPYLWGVRVYQHLKRNPDGSVDKHNATREIFTFRTASSKQEAGKKWFHPGSAPVHLLDEAYTWAKDQWDNHIAPEIVLSLKL